MYVCRKSDRGIVPTNAANKVGKPTAELQEGRPMTNGNPEQEAAHRTQSRRGASTRLGRIREAAERDKNTRFTALMHHLTVDLLRESYLSLKRDATSGVDEMTWKEYANGLEERLETLHDQVQKGRYRAKPSKRIYIPKPDGRQRPIGITALEDKIVQGATVSILKEVYEVDFRNFSYGFRPKRKQHDALDALYVGITKQKINWILDADLKSYFDTINHKWLVRFLEHRIGDKRIIRLIGKWLRAGVSEDGEWSKTTNGTPQGAVISPLLANIYLHYVLDQWVNKWRKSAKGEVIIVRYADDFVMGFQYQREAKRFQRELKKRLEKFALTLNEEKTRLIEFGRYAARDRQKRGETKPQTFDFLGFTHICAIRRGTDKFFLLRLPSKKKIRRKLEEIYQTLKRMRHEPLEKQGAWLRSVFRGQLNYYAVPGTAESLTAIRKAISKRWLKALRRRSQKKSKKLTWERFGRVVEAWLPTVKIIHPFPWKRLRV
jgi:group II intron reverse transcriptase/maturase